MTCLDTVADRVPNPEGYDDIHQRGENEWKRFVSNSEASLCSLEQDDALMERGVVIQCKPSSTGDV